MLAGLLNAGFELVAQRHEGVDFGDDFVKRDRPSIGQHLPRALAEKRLGAFQRHQQAGLQLRLGAGDFGSVNRLGGVDDVVDDQAHAFG
mgnify:CR=1 FL=1